MEGEAPGQDGAGGEVGGGAEGGADIRPLEEDDPAVLGSYTLLGRLASGGMGRIFLARSVPGGALAAVKTLLAEGEIDAVDRRRFAREVTVARRAEGVRTARVLDADPDAPRPWMATEYVPAPSVAELVRRAGPLAGTAARWVTRGALESLAELHRQGIVHRDVKPQNLLLELAGPRLIDFGISHAADLTRTQLTLGTVAFTSPEQALGEPSTAASDVYSLGATLFHLAVGRPPYPADTEMLLLLTYVAEGRLDLAGLPDELAPVVRACLALSPADRPRTAELLDLFTFELAEFPTVPDAGGWLPASWAGLIEGYARQGRALAADPRVLREGGDAAGGGQGRQGPAGGWPEPAGGGAPGGTQLPPDTVREAPSTVRERAATGSEPTRPEPYATPVPGTGGQHGDGDDGTRDVAGDLHGDADESEDEGHGRGARVFVRSVQTLMASILLVLVVGGAYAYYRSNQSPEPDATDRAFAAVTPGDCVRTDFDPARGWTAAAPETVACGSAPDAPWRVIATEDGGFVERCMGTDAAVAWNRQSDAGFVSLCLERRFAEGECVIGAAPQAGAVLDVTPLTDDTVFATTVGCSDTAAQGRAVLRVLAVVQDAAGCPEPTQVRYRFSERGRMLCLTSP
ncbi:serine/threonine-protein kinase [Streptomyces sp. WMMC500]|uniref:serine/threonine-protein kinase n=1 Tax=Streptomyces sp. WMMC500 TaxID=3015154 RepID=UPI00248C365C|nr:serine/threonine-protein kinase [Streptomyces sp. WMMC500]WBB64562.1 serine/threonine-protein kinase [Streptomyces sp. WMMC500]